MSTPLARRPGILVVKRYSAVMVIQQKRKKLFRKESTLMINAVTPSWNGMMRNLRREGTPDRVYYFEHGIADSVQEALAKRYDLWHDLDARNPALDLDCRLAVHRFLGHELFRIFPPKARVQAPKRDGAWVEEGRGAVTTWADFETFPWPDPKDADLSVMERLESLAPDNMRAFHVMDVWEVVRHLMGFETLCIALFEDPELVEAIFEKVGCFVEGVTRALCDFDTFGAVYIGDDLGHKTGPMIAPHMVRRFILPWHKRLADLAHGKGKLFLFHSCGDMYDLIENYINDVVIDAKHSFEDNVLPVTEVKRRYGSRLSLLGGVDVDLLARGDETSVRKRVREILNVCQRGGGYSFGSGNWVTDYIPVKSYLIALDEARRFGR